MHSQFTRTLLSLEWEFITKELDKRTRSSLGSQFAQNLLPNFNSNQIQTRNIDRIAEAMLLIQKSGIPAIITGATDPRDDFEMVQKGGTLSPLPLLQAAQYISIVSELSQNLIQFNQDIKPIPLLYSDWNLAPPLPSICKQIKSSISPDGTILDSASTELKRLRSSKSSKKGQIESTISNRIKYWDSEGVLQENFYDVIDGRYVVPVRVSAQNKIKGTIFGKSNTGLSVFVEPAELTQFGNELKEIDFAIQAEEWRILSELSKGLAAICSPFIPYVDLLSEFDFLLASAHFAIDFGCSKPHVNTNHLEFINLFHPALVTKQNIKIIRNSFELKSNGLASGLMISGPNTGGKTVLMKAAGLAICMAHAGLYTPTDEGTQIPHYSSLIALIGDDQNIEQGLSSFSSQILDLKLILENKPKQNSKSIVLVDEILSSTDPSEAAALAQSFIEEALKSKIDCIITTHFSELTTRLKSNDQIIVCGMEFSLNRPTYKIQLGEFGVSHAIDVAENLNFPKNLIARARSFQSQEKLNYEKALKDLKNKELELKEEYEEKLHNVKIEHEKEVKTLHQKLSDTIKAMEELFETKINDLKKRFDAYARMKTVKNLDQKLDEEKHEFTHALKTTLDITTTDTKSQNKPSNPRSFKENDPVLVLSMGKQNGVILKVNTDQTALIQVGNFKVTKPLKDLEIDLKKLQSRPKTNVNYSNDDNLVTKLDLRGVRYEQAMSDLQTYLHAAFQNRIPFVTVVTGHGTGAIKNGLKDLTKNMNIVKDIRPENELNDGAWIIEFDI